MKSSFLIYICFAFVIIACSSSGDDTVDPMEPDEPGYVPQPYTLEVPPLFEQLLLDPLIPSNNPLTVEGVALGRKLFYDPILSGDGTLACAGCHSPENAFTDERQFSVGIDGIEGNRNSMPLYNMAWNYNEDFFCAEM